jgi:hypothetical protein
VVLDLVVATTPPKRGLSKEVSEKASATAESASRLGL